MGSGSHKLRELATQRTLHTHTFSKLSTQASFVLTDLLSHYLTLLTFTCAKCAQHAHMLYASTRVRFHFVLCHSCHLSVIPVIPVISPSPPSFYLTYRSLSFIIVSPSFIFRPFLRYGSIPPLSCSEHHFSVLWLHYLTLTSLHSCGWTISLLSS